MHQASLYLEIPRKGSPHYVRDTCLFIRLEELHFLLEGTTRVLVWISVDSTKDKATVATPKLHCQSTPHFAVCTKGGACANRDGILRIFRLCMLRLGMQGQQPEMLCNQGRAGRFESDGSVVIAVVICAALIAGASSAVCAVDMQKVLVVDKLGLLVVDVCMCRGVQAGSDADGEHKSDSAIIGVAAWAGKQTDELNVAIVVPCKEPLVQRQQLSLGRDPGEPVDLILDVQQAGLDGQLGNVKGIAGEWPDGDPDEPWLSCLCFATSAVFPRLASIAVFVAAQGVLW